MNKLILYNIVICFDSTIIYYKRLMIFVLGYCIEVNYGVIKKYMNQLVIFFY